MSALAIESTQAGNPDLEASGAYTPNFDFDEYDGVEIQPIGGLGIDPAVLNWRLDNQVRRPNAFGVTDAESAHTALEAFTLTHEDELDADEVDTSGEVYKTAQTLGRLANRESLLLTQRFVTDKDIAELRKPDDEPEDRAEAEALLAGRRDADERLADVLRSDERLDEETAKLAVRAIQDRAMQLEAKGRLEYADQARLRAAEEYVRQQTEYTPRHAA